MTRADQVKATVVELFLRTGKAVEATEIARALGWSAQQVRDVMMYAGGCIDGLAKHRETPLYSSRYQCIAYEPTLETLRELRALIVLPGST